ncbi:hypothetical protein FQR65_LT07904 [Abscondita terminalis]|nr:hypothetical protein FQR65_LT07904 [Abscondita terminalis]
MGFCMDITLGFSSLYWITPSVFLCATIFAGSTRLIIPKFDPTLIWKSIEKYKPTFMYGIPFHYLRLVETKPLEVNVESIKHIATGGGNLLENQLRRVSEAFPNSRIFGGYGQTEMAMYITSFRPNSDYVTEKPTSCGIGVPGISYKDDPLGDVVF